MPNKVFTSVHFTAVRGKLFSSIYKENLLYTVCKYDNKRALITFAATRAIVL